MEIVVLGKLIILVGKIELLIKLVFEIVLKELLLPVDAVVHGEFVELIELDESESKSVESSLEGVFFPILKFDSENMFHKLE